MLYIWFDVSVLIELCKKWATAEETEQRTFRNVGPLTESFSLMKLIKQIVEKTDSWETSEKKYRHPDLLHQEWA